MQVNNSEKQLSTLLEILNFSAELLKQKDVPEARLNAELMLAGVLNCSRMNLYMDFDKPLTKEEREKFKVYLRRRLNREPLQYILGEASFYGYEFKVNPGVLIPRPETELLVERVLEDIKRLGKSPVNIFEAGTGSGCISISIANELKKQNIDFKITSIEKSPEALKLAEENLNRFTPANGQVTFKEQDLFDIEKIEEGTDYFISNPPYIAKAEFEDLQPEVKEFEPRISLTDEDDGMKFFKKIFELYLNGAGKFTVMCEIAYNRKDKLAELLESMNIHNYRFYKDYSNNYRILELQAIPLNVAKQ